MKKAKIIVPIIALILALLVGYKLFENSHTFTLSNTETSLKAERIQPIFGKVSVTSSCDTDVIFTDVETGREYVVGYITPGMGDSIELEKGKLYSVEGDGDLTVKFVDVCVG